MSRFFIPSKDSIGLASTVWRAVNRDTGSFPGDGTCLGLLLPIAMMVPMPSKAIKNGRIRPRIHFTSTDSFFSAMEEKIVEMNQVVSALAERSPGNATACNLVYGSIRIEF